jgi:CHAT domain-containing protein
LLTLSDGALTVYDLESLRRAPHTLVLSACESGLSDVRPGDELMGLAAALFALGTATVIGSVIAVADEATVPLMSAFHRHLALGAAPSVALARAQADESGDRSATLAAGGRLRLHGRRLGRRTVPA